MIRAISSVLALGFAGMIWVVCAATTTPTPPLPTERPLVPDPLRTECNTNDTELTLLREHGGCVNDPRRCDDLEAVEETCQILQEIFRWR